VWFLASSLLLLAGSSRAWSSVGLKGGGSPAAVDDDGYVLYLSPQSRVCKVTSMCRIRALIRLVLCVYYIIYVYVLIDVALLLRKSLVALLEALCARILSF